MEQWQETYDSRISEYEEFSIYEDEGNKALNRIFADQDFRDKTVLEVGCGTGKFTKLLAEKASKLYAVEVSTPLIEAAKKKYLSANLRYINCSAANIPLKNKSIDVVFASWAISAMTDEDRKATFRELDRLVRPGGEVWLIENAHDGDFMDMRGKDAGPGEVVYTNEMVAHGFEIIDTIDTNFSFPDVNTAVRVLSYIFGKNAKDYLKANNNAKMRQRLMILCKKYR